MGILVAAFYCLVCVPQPYSLHADEGEHFVKAFILLKAGKYIEAAVEFEKEIDQNPTNIEAYNSLGGIYQYHVINYPKAKSIYLRGLKQSPLDHALNLNLMYVYFEIGEIDKGIKQYEILSNLKTKDGRFGFTREALEVIFEDMEEEEEIEFSRKYLSMNPTDLILRERLVSFYKEKKDFEKMKNELEELLKLGDYSAPVYFDLGSCYYNLGNPELALEYFLKAKESGAFVPDAVIEKVQSEIEKNN